MRVKNNTQKRRTKEKAYKKKTERIRMPVMITDINELNISLEEKPHNVSNVTIQAFTRDRPLKNDAKRPEKQKGR